MVERKDAESLDSPATEATEDAAIAPHSAARRLKILKGGLTLVEREEGEEARQLDRADGRKPVADAPQLV